MKTEQNDLLQRLREGRTYFLGIGGSGMYGVACLADMLGLRVCGADQKETRNTLRLREKGIPLFSAEDALPDDISAVVYTLACTPQHPILAQARERGILCFDRPTFLGMLSRAFPLRAAVAGTHGKSTTTAMCAEILQRAGCSPTVLCGAELSRREGGFRKGEGQILLFEACEYKNAFLSFCPTHALSLDVSWEHTDFFADKAAVLSSFSAYLSGKDVRVSVAPKHLFSANITYGEGGDFWAKEIAAFPKGSRFTLMKNAHEIGRVTLRVLGDFQIQNALAAAALCASLGASDEAITEGLCAFGGIPRRMEYMGDLFGAPLYLDFAHHPKELEAAIRTAGKLGRSLALVFEPHTFSRTKAFYEMYIRALQIPHLTGVLPIYAAREQNTYGVSAKKIAKDAAVAYLHDYQQAARFLCAAARKRCTLLLCGAGGVEQVLTYLPSFTGLTFCKREESGG